LKLEKLGFFFSSFNATPANKKKKLLWLVLADEISLVSSLQLYLSSLCLGEGIHDLKDH